MKFNGVGVNIKSGAHEWGKIMHSICWRNLEGQSSDLPCSTVFFPFPILSILLFYLEVSNNLKGYVERKTTTYTITSFECKQR